MTSQPNRSEFERLAEEKLQDHEMNEIYKIGRGKKKKETSARGVVLIVESVLAQLHVAVEEDAQLNINGKPAITKLRSLSLLTDIIPRKHLQQEFLDHGVLVALKDWLEPLPDGSMPCIDIRAAVLKCLNDLTIDLDQSLRRDQMKMSGIGKAVMFYYKYDEETTANRKLAKELVDKWCRVIFKKSMGFIRTKNVVAGASHLDLPKLPQERNSEPSSSQHPVRPEAMSMDFVVRPGSKVDPEAVRARAKRMGQVQPRAKLTKKLNEMRARKRSNYRP